MKALVNKMQDQLINNTAEIKLLREFKHDTNVHLHTHGGKITVIESQQNSINSELSRIREILEQVLLKFNKIITAKERLIGAGMVFVPTVTGMFFLFRWYLKSRGL